MRNFIPTDVSSGQNGRNLQHAKTRSTTGGIDEPFRRARYSSCQNFSKSSGVKSRFKMFQRDSRRVGRRWNIAAATRIDDDEPESHSNSLPGMAKTIET